MFTNCTCRPPLSAVAVHVGRVALSPELLSWVLVRQPATQLASNTDVQISADQDSSADMPNQTAQQSTEPDTQPSNGSQAAQEELKPGSAVIFTELRGLLQLLPREVGAHAGCYIQAQSVQDSCLL
jgi:hypothetical protein